MKYIIEKNRIKIIGKDDFCPEHILECGQIFSYKEIENGYIVLSADKIAKVFETENGYNIETSYTEYFENFFDLKTNYSTLKKELKTQFPFLEKAINFGHGLRLLNQDVFETIISFIVSANNNIKRIQKILFAIREMFGKNMGEYNAFPTLQELKVASVDDFKRMGAGYRAEYLYKAVRQLENENLETWKNLSTTHLNIKLLRVMGVGQKVADCIMLFAFARRDVFPVDTWIEKVYNQYFEPCTDRVKIRRNLVDKFKNLSGYAQQYLFFYQRNKKI